MCVPVRKPGALTTKAPQAETLNARKTKTFGGFRFPRVFLGAVWKSFLWPTKLRKPLGAGRFQTDWEIAASVAQLDRASDFGSEGCRFKSCRTRHFSPLAQRGPE